MSGINSNAEQCGVEPGPTPAPLRSADICQTNVTALPYKAARIHGRLRSRRVVREVQMQTSRIQNATLG